MSDRSTSGRGAGRGRGYGRGRNNYNNKAKATTKKTLEDYVYGIGTSKQAAEYVANTSFMINYIKKTFDRI